ncbi:MAG: PIN domain-containing protein [Planctomycetes bacterium]|nr:PIN domain-containing protein [Planctomycetota bacterium]
MKQLVYWDSDCFVGWLEADEPDKKSACQGTLEKAEKGDLLIVTSALTIAEVLCLRGHKALPKAQEQKVVAFFESPFIEIRQVDRRVAEQARRMVWDNRIHPKDAIHVATALAHSVPMLNTFDAGLIKHDGKVGVPGLRIARPNIPGQKDLFQKASGAGE